MKEKIDLIFSDLKNEVITEKQAHQRVLELLGGGSRLFAVMADEFVIMKLYWKKEDADKELEVYKREHDGSYFFVEEVDVC
jgi:hypothetical protein